MAEFPLSIILPPIIRLLKLLLRWLMRQLVKSELLVRLFILLVRDNRCTDEFRVSLAREFRWSIVELAPHIGLSVQDANDIQEQYCNPVEQRIHLLEKWSQKFGRKARYYKLRKGFEKIDRKDIADYIRKNHTAMRTTYLSVLAAGIALSLVMWIYISNSSLFHSISPLYHAISTDTANTSLSHMSTNYSLNIIRPASHKHVPWNGTDCNSRNAQSDLPRPSYQFIGRAQNVSYVTKMLLTSFFAHILNINGPPGFGKSSLAIHAGHNLVSTRCVDVRYIDTTEHYMFKRKKNQNKSTTIINDDIRHTELQEHWSKSQPCQYKHCTYEKTNPQSKTESSMLSLLEWANSVEYPTLLILDNCDEVLHSSLRNDFIELIKEMGQIQHENVKIIVTSQEKLLLHNNFIALEVRELDPADSNLLLTHLVPNISSHDALELADAVGGSPLALTVIGRIINGTGVKIIPILSKQLKTELIKSLDKVSDRKSKFSAIMDTAWSYIDNDTQECALYLSYFPGSFDELAKISVLSSLKKTNHYTENLIQHSLLDEFFHHYNHRFIMHKLIREYFKKRDDDKSRSSFDQIFTLHYSELLLNYTVLYVSQFINIEEEHRLLTESHNIDYLSQILRVKLHNIYTDILQKLTRLFSEPLVLYSKDTIKQIFLWAISKDTIDFLHKTLGYNHTHTSYYKEIIEHAHGALCELKDDQIGDYDESCDLLQCNITTLTAELCEDIQSQVCTQVMSLNQMCRFTFHSILWNLHDTYQVILFFLTTMLEIIVIGVSAAFFVSCLNSFFSKSGHCCIVITVIFIILLLKGVFPGTFLILAFVISIVFAFVINLPRD